MIYLTEGMLLQINPECQHNKLHQAVPMLNLYMSMFHLNETKLRVAHFLAQTLHESGGFRDMQESWKYSKSALLKTFKKYFNESNVDKYVRSPNIFNKTYANRMGNGDEVSGDGLRYRGRALIQLTGKEDYRKFTSWYQQKFPQYANYNVVELLLFLEKNMRATIFYLEIRDIRLWYQQHYPFEREKIDFVDHPELIALDMKYAIISALWEFCIKLNLNHIADADDFMKITHKINGGENGISERRLFLSRQKKF